jgi:hypothetical protein
MNKNHLLIPPRQQKLEFAQDDLWRQFSKPARRACQTLLTELLVQVIGGETEHSIDERSEHERQDQP